jgi:hypothetical protein
LYKARRQQVAVLRCSVAVRGDFLDHGQAILRETHIKPLENNKPRPSGRRSLGFSSIT